MIRVYDAHTVPMQSSQVRLYSLGLACAGFYAGNQLREASF